MPKSVAKKGGAGAYGGGAGAHGGGAGAYSGGGGGAGGDKLFFHSASKDVAPGKGVNEVVASPAEYATLAAIPHWRKVLSNFHVCPFTLHGRTYRTIEHAFQAAKIALADASKASRFTVESGHEIGLGDGKAARGGRKLAILSKAQLALWDTLKDSVMEEAARAKFSVCPDARAVLQATNHAELWHVVARSPVPIRFVHLERLRDEQQ